MNKSESTVIMDGEPLFQIDASKKAVICDSIPPEELDADLKRRIQWAIDSKYQACLTRLMNRWLPILQERYESLPTRVDALVALIHSQPDYEMAKRVSEPPTLDQI